MTPTELRTLCAAIWGEETWAPRCADFLQVKGRTVHRWMRGDAIPDSIREELLAEAERRAADLDDVLTANQR